MLHDLAASMSYQLVVLLRLPQEKRTKRSSARERYTGCPMIRMQRLPCKTRQDLAPCCHWHCGASGGALSICYSSCTPDSGHGVYITTRAAP